MAKIKGVSGNKSILQIRKWLGVNESPDGDTGLKDGEAAEMRNFRVTREGHLQLRPGSAVMCRLTSSGDSVDGLWYGYVGSRKYILAACGGYVYKLDRDPVDVKAPWNKTSLGYIGGAGSAVTFFGFDKKVYILNGDGYRSWDGSGEIREVEGYIPLTVIASPPEGGGTVLERVNLLNGKRRQRFSPDGTSTEFNLAEDDIDRVISVEGTNIGYTVDPEAGKVRFSSPPAAGTDCLTVTYRKGDGDREKVERMRACELFGGGDNRVFLYGDGSNECIYSGLDQFGRPTAEYFPDLNTAAVGTANTPITAMIRHYDRLLCYKSDGAYSMEYTTVNLADGSVTAAFRIASVNREIGCAELGQVQLVDNDPRTVFGSAVYRWPLSTAAVRDERNAKPISDRVSATLKRWDLKAVRTFDDPDEREYYLFGGGEEILVHNYASDTWYAYTGLDVQCMAKVEGDVCFGTSDGCVMRLSRDYRNDEHWDDAEGWNEDIDAYWESGSMDFDREWMRKYSTLVWVGMKPETQGLVYLTAQSNRKSDYPQKVIATGLANFTHTSFAHWSFRTNRKPQVIRAKLKVKKATFYKLVLWSKSSSATATVVSVDIQVRYTGNVK